MTSAEYHEAKAHLLHVGNIVAENATAQARLSRYLLGLEQSGQSADSIIHLLLLYIAYKRWVLEVA